ncbi:MAG: lipopolysaccharide heptosyltransferase I [Desulfobacterales bacterium]
MNILIVKLSAIGDVIHTLPALNAVRKHHPDAHITWLVEEDAATLIEGHEALDRILVSKRKRWIKSLRSASCLSTIKEIYRFIKVLRDTRYDMILDFQALLKSGILIALARGRRKIGFGQGLEHMEHSYLFLNEHVPAVSMEHHALSRGLMFLNALGIPTPDVEYNLPVSDYDRKKVEDLLQRYGVVNPRRFVAINPVAKWESKLWSNRKFAELADRIAAQYDVEVVFTGSFEDRRTIHQIKADMGAPAVNLAGETTLKMLAALYAKADVVISTDTGPMHLAVAMGTPVVALFGPTAPWRTGPFGSGHQVVTAGQACAPCFKRHCQTYDCMTLISIDQVFNAVSQIIEKKNGQA